MRRLRRPLARLLATLMLAIAAAIPLRPASHATPAPFAIELCTAEGIVRIALEPDEDTPAPGAAAAPCLLCHGLPGVAVPAAPAAPSLDRLIVARDLTRADAAPRAPPLAAVPDHPPTAPPLAV